MKPYMIKTKSLAYEDPLFMLLDMEVKHIILYHTFVAKVNSHILVTKIWINYSNNEASTQHLI